MSERKEEWPAIGIDLGTTYSCAAVLQNGRVEIIPSDQGSRTTLSLVAFTDTVRLIGEAAVNQRRLNHTNTIFDAKRLIGRTFDDKMVKGMKLSPFNVISGTEFGKDGKPLVVVFYKHEEKYFSAEEISAMILMKMKDSAEAYLNMPVKNAVVTVPAIFNDSQRQATKDAGAIAGLNVRIINEPTAAAIAYGYDSNISDKHSSRKNVLVFDLGGGNFDVSFVSIRKDKYTVKAVGGNTHLGGSDFDNNMINHFVEEFKSKHGKDVSQSPKALARLRVACERAKKALSLITETIVEVDCLFEDIDFTSSISRACFETLNEDLFVDCIRIVEECLEDGGIDKSEVDDILLVGGSTRIPKIQQLLQKLFNGKELCRSVNPDEAVAYGAAVSAATLCGVTNDKDIVLSDVTPLSLRVMADNGILFSLLPRNTIIPRRESLVIPRNRFIPTIEVPTYPEGEVEMNICGKTNASPTSLMKISLYEGEGLTSNENNLLGVIDLDVSPSIGSQSSVYVCFDIDVNGILNVSELDTHTGNEVEIKIINRCRLTTEEVDVLMKEAEEYKVQDKEYEEMVKAKNTLENRANELLEMANNEHNKLTKEYKTLILKEAAETLDWIEQNSGKVNDAAMYQDKLEALENACKPEPKPSSRSQRSTRRSIEDVDLIMKEAECKPQDKEYEDMVKAKNKLENYAKEQLEKANNLRKNDGNKNLILEAVQETLRWLHQNSGKVFKVAIYEQKLENLEKVCISLNQTKPRRQSTGSSYTR